MPGWSNADADTNGNCYSNGDIDTHDNSYSYADSYSRAQSHTQAAADPAPKALSQGHPSAVGEAVGFPCSGSGRRESKGQSTSRVN